MYYEFLRQLKVRISWLIYVADIEFTIGAKLAMGHENSEKLGLYEAPEPFYTNVNKYDENELNFEIGKYGIQLHCTL